MACRAAMTDSDRGLGWTIMLNVTVLSTIFTAYLYHTIVHANLESRKRQSLKGLNARAKLRMRLQSHDAIFSHADRVYLHGSSLVCLLLPNLPVKKSIIAS